MSSKDHIHKFKRRAFKTGSKVYFCTDNCGYRIGVEFSLGKICRCNSCDKPFRMNEYSIRAAKPKCMNCIKRRTSTNDVEIIDVNLPDRRSEIRRTDDKLKNEIIAESSISDLHERMEKVTTIIKEYNPDDEKDLL